MGLCEVLNVVPEVSPYILTPINKTSFGLAEKLNFLKKIYTLLKLKLGFHSNEESFLVMYILLGMVYPFLREAKYKLHYSALEETGIILTTEIGRAHV